MKINQEVWTEKTGWKAQKQEAEAQAVRLVLAFSGRAILENNSITKEISAKYPTADVVFCSTAGEIQDTNVRDASISVTAIQFEKTRIRAIALNPKDYDNNQLAGEALAQKFDKTGLKHMFVISDGQTVNGSSLVDGFNKEIGSDIAVTGGLAGDGYDFTKTLVGLNEIPQESRLLAIAFYGENIEIGYGSDGGWDAFGPERKVTKSKDNVLYELDGKSALELYKSYLGEAAKELPSSALYYPLSIKLPDVDRPVVRTILSVDEEEQSMTFAGNLPEGVYARLMKHNTDKLVDGAESAAQFSLTGLEENKPELAILVSCVGRKIVLGQNIEEEVEIVRDVFGKETAITGFYSYGEIAPFPDSVQCELHNQTMTITTFREV